MTKNNNGPCENCLAASERYRMTWVAVYTVLWQSGVGTSLQRALQLREQYLQEVSSTSAFFPECGGPHKCAHEASSSSDLAAVLGMNDAVQCVEKDIELYKLFPGVFD